MGGVEARKAPASGRANSGIVASSLRNAPHPGPLPAGGERESAPRTEHSRPKGGRGVAAACPLPLRRGEGQGGGGESGGGGGAAAELDAVGQRAVDDESGAGDKAG